MKYRSVNGQMEMARRGACTKRRVMAFPLKRMKVVIDLFQKKSEQFSSAVSKISNRCIPKLSFYGIMRIL